MGRNPIPITERLKKGVRQISGDGHRPGARRLGQEGSLKDGPIKEYIATTQRSKIEKKKEEVFGAVI